MEYIKAQQIVKFDATEQSEDKYPAIQEVRYTPTLLSAAVSLFQIAEAEYTEARTAVSICIDGTIPTGLNELYQRVEGTRRRRFELMLQMAEIAAPLIVDEMLIEAVGYSHVRVED